MRLHELQRALAASLAAPGEAVAPEGCDVSEVARARRALEAKRRRAAAHLLPRSRRALGERWAERFHEHAARYAPCGLLTHVDDAWALAESLAGDGGPALRLAARDDLLGLRLRWVRRPGNGDAGRIGERVAPLIALAGSAPRALIIRGPGPAAAVWRIPLTFRRHP